METAKFSIEDLVTAVSQAVFHDAFFFLVGRACSLGATNYPTHTRALYRPGGIAGYCTDQPADDCAAGSAGAGFLLHLFGNLFGFCQVDIVLLHINTGGIDDGLA